MDISSNSNNILKVLSDLLINKPFRWIILGILIVLTILSYVQEPIRFSGKLSKFGITFKLQYFILIFITMCGYIFNFLGLELTIPFSKNFPPYWYIPIIIIIFAIITDITFNTDIITNKNNNLEPPPSYLLPKKYRLIIFYLIIIFDILAFVQQFIYSGISIEFKTTLLHQFILNRFGGFKPGNVLAFIISWLGILSLGIDYYNITNQLSFTACNYNLPDSWNF